MPNTPFQKEWHDIATRWGLSIETPFVVQVASGEVTGYGVSCLSEPTGVTHPGDDEALMEMLADWGWSGNGRPTS
jgi:hypothetical protein